MPYRGVRVRSRPRWSLPLLASVSISGSTPAGSVLTATVTMANIPMPRSTTVTVEWYRNASNSTSGGTLITTQASVIAIANPAEGQTSTFTYTTVDADIGDFIYAIAYARNARGTGAPSVTSGTIGAVTGVAPVISSVSISGTVQEGQTLTATINYSTVGHPTPTETFQWQYSTDGSTGWTNVASGGTSSTYSVDDTYAGYFLRCQGGASNASGPSTANSSATARVNTLYFGDGSDGDLTSSVNVTISANKKYRDWTINAGIVMATNGSVLLQVCRTLTGGSSTSTIHANGHNGTDHVNTVGTAGSVGGSGTALGGDGGAGGAAAVGGPTGGQPGSAGASTTNGSDGTGGIGGAGSDNSGTHSGGAAGTAVRTSSPSAKSQIRDNTGSYQGGAGGGGGGGGGYNVKGETDYNGPGGGEGAGVLRVLAKSIAGSGVFQALGGNAGNADALSSGAGGGGGGRVLLGSYSANKATWTIDVSAGLKSTSFSSGLTPNPTDGTAGSSYEDYGAGD